MEWLKRLPTMKTTQKISIVVAALVVLSMVGVGAVGATSTPDLDLDVDSDAASGSLATGAAGAHALIGTALCTQADNQGDCTAFTTAATAYQVIMLAPAACAITGGTACLFVLGYIG